MDKIQKPIKKKTISKVMDSLVTIKDKPSFEKLINSYDRWNIVRLKSGKDMFIKSHDSEKIYLEWFSCDNKLSLTKKDYNDHIDKVKLTSNYDNAYGSSYKTKLMSFSSKRG